MGASGVRLSVPPGYSAELVGGVSVAVAGRYRGSVYAGGGGGKPPSCCQPAVGTSEPGRNGVWALKTGPYEVYGFALKSTGCGKGGGSGESAPSNKVLPADTGVVVGEGKFEPMLAKLKLGGVTCVGAWNIGFR